MSKIGFLPAEIENGGQYADLYRRLELREQFSGDPVTKEVIGGYYAITVPDDLEPTYAWMVANKANIKWRGVDFFVEAPASFANQNVPAWLPNNTYIDENGDEQTHTFDSWGGIVRTSNDASKIIVKITANGDINEGQLTQLATIVNGNAQINGYSTKEVRVLLATPTYTES